MFQHRELNFSRDVEGIIKLLSVKSDDGFSSNHFKWKHLENPFGKSVGLLALDEQKIVGVRIFMRWEFSGRNENIKALRPVDTITHPDYRGQGIFTKLTLEALNIFKDDYEIIFNTPNSNSLNGYLKMGWKKINTCPNYRYAYVNPSRINNESIEFIEVGDIQLTKNMINGENFFRTNLSTNFLLWRFKHRLYNVAKVKLQQDYIYIIYRMGTKFGKKFIIIEELLGMPQYYKKAIRILVSSLKVRIIYYINNDFLKFKCSVARNNAIIVYNKDKFKISERLVFSSGDLDARL